MNSKISSQLLVEIDQSNLNFHNRAYLGLTYLGLKGNSEIDLWTTGRRTVGEQKDEFLSLLHKTGLVYKEFHWPQNDPSRTWDCAYGHNLSEVETLVTMCLSQDAFVTEEFGVLLGYPRTAAAQFQQNPHYMNVPIVRDMIKKLNHVFMPVRLSLDEETARKEVEEVKPWVEALKQYLPRTYQEFYDDWEEYCTFGLND
jgi:hypothetical protein